MKQIDWREKLVPFDAETARMVESLTEKECKLKNGGDHYFYEADYSLHDSPDYVNAIYTSIEGRLGKRLIDITDDAESKKLIIKVRFSDEKLPRYYQFEDSEPQPRAGRIYTKEVYRAIEFIGTIECARLLSWFVGGGEVEIPEEDAARFFFSDKISGVQREVKEGDYIMYVKDKPFKIIPKEEFEKTYIMI